MFKRLYQLPEIEDLASCPVRLRTLAMDYLRGVADLFCIFDCVGDRLSKVASLPRSFHAFDLCSGSGGPWPTIYRKLRYLNFSPTVTLSDLYPPNDADLQLPNAITWHQKPVDVRNLQDISADLITLFNAFHHLTPEEARNLLDTLTKSKVTAYISEITERSFASLFMVILTPLWVLIITPFIRPITFDRFLLTYLIPAIPIFTLVDGTISVLRSFTLSELQEIGEHSSTEEYRWSVEQHRTYWFLPSVMLLIGEPTSFNGSSEM